MKKINILFTCAGRRNYLINYFKEVLNGNGNVVAADSDLSAPAMVDADIAIKVPRVDASDYIDALRQIIIDQHITAVIPLNDLELPILSKNKNRLEVLGARVLISDEMIIDIAFDKWKTYHFFINLNINTPKTYLSVNDALNAIKNNEINYPLIVKPRWGSASIGIEIAENEEELLLTYKLLHIKIAKSILKGVSSGEIEKSIIIQEKVNGTEYGVDILNDFTGNYYGSFVRKKLYMRAGETDKAISVINEEFSKTSEIIGNATGHIGNMDCDFFVSDTNVIYFLEMNPRFGGGYPFSHEAGINIPAIYLSWLNNNNDITKFNNYKANMMFSKYDRLMNINSNL